MDDLLETYKQINTDISRLPEDLSTASDQSLAERAISCLLQIGQNLSKADIKELKKESLDQIAKVLALADANKKKWTSNMNVLIEFLQALTETSFVKHKAYSQDRFDKKYGELELNFKIDNMRDQVKDIDKKLSVPEKEKEGTLFSAEAKLSRENMLKQKAELENEIQKAEASLPSGKKRHLFFMHK